VAEETVEDVRNVVDGKVVGVEARHKDAAW